MSDYSFGDTDLAAQRLAHVDRVFQPSSRAFLSESGLTGCALAVDLGCGPGFTTRLVREVLRCERVVGLDASARFVEVAGRQSVSGVGFLEHDVMDLPFPTGPADLLHARLLVSHLKQPERAIRGFVSQLRPAGRLLLDEVEWIRTESPIFGRYLGIVADMLSARGQCLYVGPRLDSLTHGLCITRADVRVQEVDTREAAAMFSLNLEQLRHNEDLMQRVSQLDLDALAADLSALREDGGPAIRWGLRQLVIEA